MSSVIRKVCDIVVIMSKKVKNLKPLKVANPEWSAAMREIGRSSATNKHDTRPNKLRTRENVKRNAIKDSQE